MALSQRLCGPVLTNVSSATLFAGVDEIERMKSLRGKITEIRRIWQDTDAFNDLKAKIQTHISHESISPKTMSRVLSLLEGYSDWADMDYKRPDGQQQSFTAIELYCSEEGYNLLFGIFNTALRQKETDENVLFIAAALVEFVTIELYNLRLANIGDPRYENYEGVTFRGMCVSKEMAAEYRKAASNPDLSRRHFAVPLGFTSSSTSRNATEEFVKKYPLEDQMHWIIHIHGLDSRLSKMYEDKYSDSVVTSISAMPVGRIAELREKEILLRGAFFHIVHMESIERDGRTIHTLKLVVMNTNRDHGTELALDEGAKQEQRNFFRDMIIASRFRLCASLVKEHNVDESSKYEELAKTAERRINSAFHLNDNFANLQLDQADPTPAAVMSWYGDMSGSSFPVNYFALREKFHAAARVGEWNTVRDIMMGEYEWQASEWFNIPALDAEGQRETLLHEMASHGPPASDSTHKLGWEYLTDQIAYQGGRIWKTQKSTGSHQTAESIASQNGHEILAHLLEPEIQWVVEQSRIDSWEEQLDRLVKESLTDHKFNHDNFALPQLSILSESQQSRLWIPIPNMYGGFLLIADGGTVKVRKFETVKEETKPHVTEYAFG